MQRTILSVSALAALLVLTVAAAPAGASSPNKVAPDLGENQPTAITVSLKCQIVGVNADDKVVLRDIESGAEKEVTIAPSIKLRARHKRDFDGRRKLAFEDLGVGQTVKVTVLRQTGQITRIDVLEKAG